MTNLNFNEIIHSAGRYFLQQSEIFGDEFYLNRLKVPDRVMDLDAYARSIEQCQQCSLSQTRNHFVFGTGNPRAGLMLIGEAPGEEEDCQGKPFVGKAGQLLDKILAAIEFKREEVYIANVLKCRPPKNRDPLPEETAMCLSYLNKQIELIRPRLILLLGRIAAQSLLKTTASLTQLRCTIHHYREIPVLVTFHPAALLRNPQWKVQTWEDVQKLRKLYDERVGDKPSWTPKKKS